MAATKIPAPGTKLGPCADECAHLDCRASREQATRVCGHCGEPIGYDRWWCNFAALPYHEACLDKMIEAGR